MQFGRDCTTDHANYLQVAHNFHPRQPTYQAQIDTRQTPQRREANTQ